ncbi:uncharacterized protein LOC122058630 [Macadamia integrifolia]|uniref:uncharacterized protein LOC122058630 n=1 Tax=Macadamia integrifolia TaxID=60698 RepID=UPI001C533832|nr:uncharacterized protein LOC122058630 [Macadamia integrifolia]
MTAIISPSWGTVLHVAVSTGHLHLVKKLMELMTSDAISTCTRACHNPPLSIAARCGFTRIAEVLVKKSSDYLGIPDQDGLIPVVTASRYGNKDTTRYLYEVTTKNVHVLTQGDSKSGALLLNAAIIYEIYDMVIDLLRQSPELAITYHVIGWTTIRVLATKPKAFPSGELYSPWQRWIYTCAPIHNERDIFNLDVADRNKDHIGIGASHWLYGVVWGALKILGKETTFDLYMIKGFYTNILFLGSF